MQLRRSAIAIAPAVLLVLALAGSNAQAQAQAQAQTPDRLSEVYGDWTVHCVGPQDSRQCIMAQSLNAAENNQRILQVEVSIGGGQTELAMLAPLGVLLPAGATTTIDGNAPSTLAYHTCLNAGCILRSTVDDAKVAELRRGKSMAVALQAAETRQTIALTVSLKGFSAAHDRLKTLSAR